MRETEVIRLIAKGFSNKLIADALGMTDHTAKFHVNNIIIKMRASTRTDAAVQFVLNNVRELVTV